MKIAQINTYDIQGGAARAAYRLHKGLVALGQDSILLSRYRVSDDPTVHAVRTEPSAGWEQASFQAIQEHSINANRTPLTNTLFSLPYPGWDLSVLPVIQAAEVINLHWVADFQSPLTLKRLLDLGKPVVWTLHDMWAFTGGCHYAAGCQKYQQDCMGCPQLAHNPHQLAAALLADKLQWLSPDDHLTIVTPSQWLADCARRSRLLQHHRIEVIPYSLETEIFIPHPKPQAKEQLGISPDVTTLLFGAGTATELRKGFPELVQAMRHCLDNEDFKHRAAAGQIEILCFGYPSEWLRSLTIPVRSLGHVEGDSALSHIYSAADLFILPSLEDNLPNTMLESLCCGTPVIAFDVGGIPDVVQDQVTGRLVPLRDTHQLAQAILDGVRDVEHREQMGQTGRQRMEADYAMPMQARRYRALYQELLANRSPAPPICDTTGCDTTGCDDTGNRENPMVDIDRSDLDSAAPLTASRTDPLTVPVTSATGQGFHRIFEDVAFTSVVHQLAQAKADLQVLQQTQIALNQAQSALSQAQQTTADLQIVLASDRQTMAQLRDDYQAAEIVRAHLLQEFRGTHAHLNAVVADQQQQLQDANNTVRKFKQQIKTLNRDHQGLLSSIEHLERELAYRSTGKAALRQLFKTALRKLKLFDFVYHRYQSVVPIYNLIFRDRWQPATIAAAETPLPPTPPAEASSPSPPKTLTAQSPPLERLTLVQPIAEPSTDPPLDLEAPLVEALVVARGLEIPLDPATTTSTLQSLADLITQTRQVLCIEPTQPLLPLLQSFAKHNATVTCVGCQAGDEAVLLAYGLGAIAQPLGQWMVATQTFDFSAYDTICLPSHTAPATLHLLQGRLAEHTTLIVLGKSAND